MGLFSRKSKGKQTRSDFWDAMSIGRTPSRFSSTRPQFVPIETDYSMLDNQFQTDGISRKIVSKPAEDMTRNGWRIVIPDDPDMQTQYQQALDALHLTNALSQEFTYMRLHGDGYATIGVQEKNGTNVTSVLDPTNIQNVKFVHAFGQEHVERCLVNNDPTSDMYGKEKAIQVNPTSNGTLTPTAVNTITIDKSRYFHVSIGKLEDDETGTSVLQTCRDQIKTLNTALYSVGKMLYEFTLKIYQSSEISGMSTDEKRKAMDILSEGMSTESVFVIGDNETMTKMGTNVAGLNSLLDFAWQSLSAASNIPKSVLTGQEAGTITGAQYDVVNYYDRIKSMQENMLKPQLEYIVQLLFWASDVAGGSMNPSTVDWSIEFNPLWSADDETQSQTLLNNMNAGAAAVSAGIMDPDEVKAMLTGQNNAVKTALDSALTTASKKDLAEYQKSLLKIIHGKK